MFRILNIMAIAVLIGSALYAYSVKYSTLYQAERIAKLERELQAEKDAIALLAAQWSYVSRPERIQELTAKYLDLQQLKLQQIVTLSALPDKVAHGDAIGQKLETLLQALPPETGGAPAPGQRTPAHP